MATINTNGVWKSVSGTLAEILAELVSDKITDARDIVSLTHDGTNFVVIYKYK